MSQEFAKLNQDAIRIWEQKAGWWDDYMGEHGNWTHRNLVAPPVERVLDIQKGETVLEAACGSGIFARRMADLGANVVAFDVSATFVERTRVRTETYGDRIEVHQIDGTDEGQMLTLGEGRFDAAVCNMALMDMADINPLGSAVARLLKPGGRFVFAVPHPCFNTMAVKKVVEEEERDGEFVTVRSVKVSEYITPRSARGIGISGEPATHFYFDRPINVLLKTFLDVGFVLDALEEPIQSADSDASRPLLWSNFPEIPFLLVARMRLAG